MMDQDNGDSGNAVENAIWNPLVLQNIFKFLPSHFLMSSCSLVNKLWNNEARVFIRENTKCTIPARTPVRNCCQFWQHLDQLSRNITAHGRVVPYNSLALSPTILPGQNCTTRPRDGQERIQNLSSPFKLLHLHVECCSDFFQCVVHKPIFELLRQKGNQLKVLSLEGNVECLETVLGSWDPYFPQLEHVSIKTLSGEAGDYPSEQSSSSIVRKILDGSPNLKKISPHDLETLRRTVPEDKFGLLDEFELKWFQSREDSSVYEKVLKAKPALKILKVLEHDAPTDPELQARFYSMLENILETCQQTLNTIEINGACWPLWQQRTPLVSLSVVKVDWSRVGITPEILRSFSSIDYSMRMPRLEVVEFTLGSVDDWPPSNDCRFLMESCCMSVRKMTIVSHCGAIDLSFFGRLFPNISTFMINTSSQSQNPGRRNLLSISQIWELWPHLRELEVNGNFPVLRKSYDGEFCGIGPKESELLAKVDEQMLDLRALQIVPTGHNVQSMNSLRKLRMNLHFGTVSDPCLKFISRVTEQVAFRKLPHADIYIFWSCNSDYYWRTETFSIIQTPQTIRTEILAGAVENPRTLHQIFSHFPTSFLLSSCSLVKKSWNREARKFILQNIKLTLAMTDTKMRNTCVPIQAWNQRCSQIVEQRRLIPWNSLKIHLNPCTFATSNVPEDIDGTMILGSQGNLKYLDFEWKYPWLGADCAIHKPLEALLRQCANELRGFTIRRLPANFGHLLADGAAQFPKLEEFTLRSLPESDFGMNERSTIRHITDAAPNLRKIFTKDPESLDLVPEDKLRLLDMLTFHFRGIQDRGQYTKVARARSALRKLRIFQRFQCHGQLENCQPAFNTALEELFAACHQTLEIISIETGSHGCHVHRCRI